MIVQRFWQWLSSLAGFVTGRGHAQPPAGPASEQELSRDMLPSILNAADRLISCPSLELVYRSLVELCRDSIGLERARLYIFSADHSEVAPTYGIDLQGEVVPEDHRPLPLTEEWRPFLRIRHPQESRWLLKEEMRTYWDGEKVIPCGIGWVAYTPLQTGRVSIGVIAHDSALTNRPHDARRQELLTVFCSLAANVIERKKNETALRQNEIKFRHVYERSLVMMHTLDQDGCMVEANTKFLEHTGYRRDEIFGRPLNSYLIEVPGARTYKTFLSDLWTQGRATEGRFGFKLKNGQIIQVLIDCAVATSLQGQPIILSVVRDITQELSAQAEISQSRRMLQLVIDSIPQYIFWKDRRGHYLGCNAHFARLAHVKGHNAIVGLTDVDLPWTKADTQEFITVDERVMTTGRIEVQIARRKIFNPGRPTWVETTRIPLRDVSGKVVGLLGTFADVSEQQALQEERARVTKLESVGELAGGIAHDFNNLLTAIDGNISLIMAKTAFDNDKFEFLEETLVACSQARELARQLLNFSKIGATSKKPTEPERFLRQAVQFALRGSSLAPVWKIDPDLPLVEIDEAQMRQVIHHLITNAVEAQESGRILVTCLNVELSGEEASPMPPGRYLRLSIADEGRGIPAEDLARVFDPYFTTKPNANGLGLSTSYFIVKKHGGNLTAQSELGKGSTFTLTLPILQGAATVALPKNERPKLGSGKILFLDDEVQIRTLTERILRALGFEVVTAAYGEQAIQYFREALEANDPFKLCIFDLTLPGGLNGVKVYEKIREIGGEVPAILISGYSDDPITRAYANHGFKALLNKPYDLAQMTDTLESLGFLLASE